ncbi:ATP-binding protein [Lentzea aerocolonigenes]|uniref:ATP-binding protein n=1 Tax=Lentzea aerocolonigenes TaxID=68170 RepID=UPI0018C8989F|nr:LuxR family transcriptional regulator [Lentzea aerocolonigenes]
MKVVGRGRELAQVRSWVAADAGGLVLCGGEPGIGKTRLAQELAGQALALGREVVWGHCVETSGAPAFWPWRQILKATGADPDLVLAHDAEVPQDRFRVFDAIASALDRSGLVVVVEDVHWADEASLLVLAHLAVQLRSVLIFATFRDPCPAVADLMRSAVRIDLHGLSSDEVAELVGAEHAAVVMSLTSGNPLFVTEIARAVDDGTWRPDQPPRSVRDIVTGRLARLSPDARELVRTAALIGRDFDVDLAAAASGLPISALDEASTLIDATGHRFVHALTRDAVEASLTTAERRAIHRRIASAMTDSTHYADVARHWSACGATAEARVWTIRAAEDAVRRLAYEEGARLYRAAASIEDSSEVQVALGRAAYFAGDLAGCVEAAQRAAELASTPEQIAEAALVLEAAPGAGVNAVATPLCDNALRQPVSPATRARLLAQRSHLAFYRGEQHRLGSLSSEALDLARESGDDRALAEALHARQEACPGPSGRAERLGLATEMIDLAHRTRSPRGAMWGSMWRIHALIESGSLAAAQEELPALRLACERVGGAVPLWHLEVVTACLAQAQGRFAEAREVGRQAYDRMRVIEREPASGAYFALQCGFACHIGVTEDGLELARHFHDPPPRFRLMSKLTRAFLLLRAGFRDEALEWYRRAGPLGEWDLPAFFVVPGLVDAVLVTSGLGLLDDLAQILPRLEAFRGEHAAGNGVAYMGPASLALGRGYLALDRYEDAAESLSAAVDEASQAGATAFAAEARWHLAAALRALGRDADTVQRAADRAIRALGMTAFTVTELSSREHEVARLVTDGLTNRQIARQLVISERTAQNHVQHILTKLGFSTRSQIAAWMSTRPSTPADG